MSLRLPRAAPRTGAARTVSALLAVAGVGLITAGLFEVERPMVPDTLAEVVHSYAAIASFVMLVAAMVLFAVVCRGDPRWQGFFPTGAMSPGDRGLRSLAAAAVGLGVLSVALHDTPTAGLGQRLLWVVLVAWLVTSARSLERSDNNWAIHRA